MSASDVHVSEFSPDGKLFAIIDGQGILRIFDTDTSELKQEYTPNLHLSGPCSALLWIVTFTSAERKSKKARTSLNTGALYIALGTNKGLVSLYSYAEAKVERCLKGDGHAGRITALEQDGHGKLFSCGEDSKVIEWSLTSEKQLSSWSVGPEKPFSLAFMSASSSLVVGSRQIKVFSVESRELLQTFTGHTSEVNLMRKFVFEEKEYAVTASRMERITCLWEIGEQGKNRPPFCTLLMEDVAYCLTCQMDKESNSLRIASVTRSGVIHIYLIDIKSVKAEKPIKPKLTISVASDGTTVEPISVIAATFQHAQRPNEILFNYGDRHFMLFEHLKPNFEEKMQVLIRTKPRNLVTQSSGANAKGTDAALKVLNPIIEDRQVDYKYSVTLGKRNKKSADLSLESRLQNLNLDKPENKTAPQAECKVHLLLQSLHSKDAVLLRSVLCTNDVKTIQLTVQKLPTRYIGALIDELTLLMHQKHVNVEFAMNWLKILAQTHSSQLMALGADELLNKFGPCIGIIEHRANCLKELSKLNGRLQLLVNQLKRDTDTEPNDFHSENLLVYEDDDSSNSEMENAGSKSDSDDAWEEDNVEENKETMDQNNDDDENMEM
uniref:Utp12 domain-containing protein n=1 Tax=Glossina pallidipes TaxID=7398 RepID=A0A1B0AGB0_GLOPL